MMGARGLVGWAVALAVAAPAGAREGAPVPLIPCMGGVVFVSDGGRSLTRAGADGATRVLHTVEGDGSGFGHGDAASFACSPDGQELAALAEPRRGGPLRLFVIVAGGTREYAPPANHRFASGLLLGADAIVATVGGGGKWGVAAIDRASGAARLLFEYVGWAPRALARTRTAVRLVWMEAIDDGVLSELPLSGGSPAVLRKLPRIGALALAPDGAAAAWIPIAAAGAPAPLMGWWIDRGPPVEILPPGSWAPPEWSRDAARLTSLGWTGARGREELALVEGGHRLPGGVPLDRRRFALDPSMRRVAALPDAPANWIDVLALPDGRRVRRLETGAPNLPGVDDLAFSLDGETLFFTRSTRRPSGPSSHHVTVELWAARVTGGAPRKIARLFDGEIPFVD